MNNRENGTVRSVEILCSSVVSAFLDPPTSEVGPKIHSCLPFLRLFVRSFSWKLFIGFFLIFCMTKKVTKPKFPKKNFSQVLPNRAQIFGQFFKFESLDFSDFACF